VYICFSLARSAFISSLVQFRFQVWRQLDSLLSSGWFLSCPTIECIHEVHLSIVVFSKLTLIVSSYSKIQIINIMQKIFPPLPGANKCQYNNKQYVTQKVNQGGYTNSTLPTGISHFLHTRAYTKESTLMWYSL
jgi:hypothetical protein